jgi:cell division protein FtsI/penicillin-binding protein 2
MLERPRNRLKFLTLALVLVCLLLVGRLVHVQIFLHADLSHKGESVRSTENSVEPMRGRIWDRAGRLLAGNVAKFEISATTDYISDVGKVTRKLASELGSHLDMTTKELSRTLSSDDKWVSIARGVPQEVGEEILAEEIGGIEAEPHWRRIYPESRLAVHLLGFVNAKGNGFYGIEGYYDGELRGQPGAQTFQQDPWGGIIPLDLTEHELPQPGVDLVLTLDRNVQALVEAELELALGDTGAKSGVIIVMNPRTGAVLAMTAKPDYDPNYYGEVVDQRSFINPAISDHYEPGSVFKVLTVAVALENGAVSPQSTFYDEGQIEVGGQLIRNASRRAYGNVTLTEVLVRSLNVEIAKISTMMGPEAFYQGIRAFGIGHRTKVDLPGEIEGNLREPGDWQWHESDLATNAFGQGVAVTPLQMITAVAGIANNGVLMKPFIVAEKRYPDGRVVRALPVQNGRAVSPETAHLVSEMMAETVEYGVPKAHVHRYRIAGKTGTAQKPTAFGYDEQKTIASFVGFAPVDDPQVIVLVRLDEPTSSSWGADTAAPVFAGLAGRLFRLLQIPPDDVRLGVARGQ